MIKKSDWRISIFLFIYFYLMSFSSLAANLCHPQDKSASPDNKVFIEFWAARLKILNDGIPELSPRESAWLDSELKAAGADSRASQRWLNAMRSNEAKLRRVKQWTTSMAILVQYWKDTPQNWILLAHYFLRYETTYDIFSLVKAGLIKQELVPAEWNVPAFEEEFINQRRMYYANLIIVCNLPKSLKLNF